MRSIPSRLLRASAFGLAAAVLTLLPPAPSARAQTTISTAVTGPVYGHNNRVTAAPTSLLSH